MIYYICARHNQCREPCTKNCLYTADFKKSKLYHNQIKPVTPIDFLTDKKNNKWEVDWSWDKNLPDSYRDKTKPIRKWTYDDLCIIEMRRKQVRDGSIRMMLDNKTKALAKESSS